MNTKIWSLLSLFILVATELPAATNQYYWTGQIDSSWETAGNWSLSSTGLPPATAVPLTSNDAVTFSANNSLAHLVTLSDPLALYSITIKSANPFVLGAPGSDAGISANGLILDTGSGDATVNAPMTFTNLYPWINRAVGTTLTFNGAVDIGASTVWVGDTYQNSVVLAGGLNGTGTLRKTEGSTLTIGGTASTSFTGATEVRGGTLILAKEAGANGIGAINIESGTVRLTANEQIDNTKGISTFGTFDLNGYTETVSKLAGQGNVNLNGGTMIVHHEDDATISEIFKGKIAGAGNLIKTGSGVWEIQGANTLSGRVEVQGGELLLSSLASVGTANVKLGGGALALREMNSFGWSLGTGANQIDMSGPGGAGFSSRARLGYVTPTIRLNGGTGQVTWGSGYFVADGAPLLFGSTYADQGVIFANSIALGNAIREIRVTDSAETQNDLATLSGAISGDGGIRKTGTGTLELTATNSFRGPLIISGGSVKATVLSAVTSANIQLDGGTLELYQDATLPLGIGAANLDMRGGGGFSGNGIFTLGSGGTMTWGSGYFVGNGKALVLGSVNSKGDARIANAINLGSTDREVCVYDNISRTDDGGTLAGILSGTGGLVKTGNGTLRLTGASTFTGSVKIIDGTLRIDSSARRNIAGPLGNNNTVIVLGDAAIAGNPQITSPGRVTLDRDLRIAGSGAAIVSPWGMNITGSVALEKDLAVEVGGDAISVGTVDMTGRLSGVGGIVKRGIGTLSLNAANTFTGDVTVEQGKLKMGATNAIASAGNLATAGGTVVDLNGYSQNVRELPSLQGSITNTSAQAATLRLTGTGPIILEGYSPTIGPAEGSSLTFNLGGVGRTFNVAFSGDATISAAITNDGGGGLTMNGPGRLRLQHANSFSGPINVVSGELLAEAPGSLGTGTSPINLWSTLLVGPGTQLTRTVIVKDGPGTPTLGATNATGEVSLGPIVIERTVDVTAGNASLDLRGPITGTGSVNLLSGAGSITLSSANNFTGDLRVKGDARFNAAGVLPTGSGLTVSGTLDLNGYSITADVSGAGRITNTSNTPVTIRLTDSPIIGLPNIMPAAGKNITIDLGGIGRTMGCLEISANITNDGGNGLILTGGTLGGQNSYTGATTIDGNVTVKSDALLTGPGSLGNNSSTVAVGGRTLYRQCSLLIGQAGVTVARPLDVVSDGMAKTKLGGSFTTGESTFASQISYSHALELTSAGGAVRFTGPISGSGTVTKTGQGTVSLEGNNNYSGTTFVNQGALRTQWGVGLPTAGNLRLEGGVLELTSDLTASLGQGAGMISGNGFAAYGGTRHVNLGGHGSQLTFTQSYFGDGLLFGSKTANARLVFDNPLSLGNVNFTGTRSITLVDNPDSTADAVEIGSVISAGNAQAKLNVYGDGTLVLSKANTFGGGLSLYGGTVVLAAPTIAGVSGPVGTGTLTISGGTLLAGDSNYVLPNNLSLGVATLGAVGGGGFEFTGNANLLGGAMTVNNSTRLGGRLSGGSFDKKGNGTLMLGSGAADAVANTYTGNTYVSEGTLVLDKQQGVNALSSTSIELRGGTIRSNRSNQINDLATVVIKSGTLDLNGGQDTFKKLTLEAGQLINAGGPLVLTDTTTPLQMNTGTALDCDIRLVSNSGKVFCYVDAQDDGPAVLSGGLDLGNVQREFMVYPGANPVQFHVSGPITGNGSIYKTSSGGLRLTGNNTYSGGTTITQGVVFADSTVGSSTGSGMVRVASTSSQLVAVLAGTGRIEGAVRVESGSYLAPGQSPDTLTYGIKKVVGSGTGSLTVDDDVAILGGAHFLINVVRTDDEFRASELLVGPNANDVTLGGQLHVTFSGSTAPSGAAVLYLVELADATTTLTGEFSNYAQNAIVGTFAGVDWRILYGVDSSAHNLLIGSGNDVALVAVPEPTTWAMMAIALLVVGSGFMRRRFSNGQSRSPAAAGSTIGQ